MCIPLALGQGMTPAEQVFLESGLPIRRILVFPDIERAAKDNPYISLFYEDFCIEVESARPLHPSIYRLSTDHDCIHFHWLEATSLGGLVRLMVKLLPVTIFVLRGGMVVHTLHNLRPHAQRWGRFNAWLEAWFLGVVSLVIVHSDRAAAEAASRYDFDPRKLRVLPHPVYRVRRRAVEEVVDFLNEQGITRPYCLMYGQVAPYKGMLEIAECFQGRHLTEHCALVIAGRTRAGEEAYAARIRELARSAEGVHFIDRFISEDEEALLFTGATATIFNNRAALTSGSVVLAYSYGTPILTSRPSDELPADADCRVFASDDELTALLMPAE